MKKIVMAVCCVIMSLGAFAQDLTPDFEKYPPVGRFEVEWLAVGTATPFSKAAEYGYDGGIQVRENIQGTPWSYGVALGAYCPFKEVEDNYIDYEGNPYTITSTKWVGGFLTGIVGEYGFSRGCGISPYINVSTGFCWGGTSNIRPYIRPAIGVEVFNHLRMSLAPTLTTGEGSGIAFNLSVVFGGGPQ